MPGKRKERVAEPGDETQAFTLAMRERLKNLKLQEEKDKSELRAVSETKVDDLIAKEAEDAKISGLYAMWYIDKTRDRMKEEEQNPSAEVLREKFNGALERLNAANEGEKEHKKAAVPATGRKGFLELTNVLDLDELVEASRLAPPPPSKEEVGRHPHAAPGAGSHVEDEDDEDEGIAEYLEKVQQLSRAQDRVSKRVMKSPEERKQDYEETKLRVNLATAALGVTGSGIALAAYGVNAAFSFGLGSVGALLYLSGLASYADNAENPMGQALGGRRLLVPVILVLMVTQWEKIEAQVPAVAAAGLQPELLPVIMGFFTYVVGKVVGGALTRR